MQGNEAFIHSAQNKADIGQNLREDRAQNGQKPYAVVLACADSRTPPEHIFSAGIGDLFVVRTAGNVVSDFTLGSIELGVQAGAPVVVVMGHNQCGAVLAAMNGSAKGYLSSIAAEIQPVIAGAADNTEAENRNIAHSCQKIMKSALIQELVETKKLVVVPAKYNLQTGRVELL